MWQIQGQLMIPNFNPNSGARFFKGHSPQRWSLQRHQWFVKQDSLTWLSVYHETLLLAKKPAVDVNISPYHSWVRVAAKQWIVGYVELYGILHYQRKEGCCQFWKMQPPDRETAIDSRCTLFCEASPGAFDLKSPIDLLLSAHYMCCSLKVM